MFDATINRGAGRLLVGSNQLRRARRSDGVFRLALGWFATVGLGLCAAKSQAACNIIPGTTTTFRGALGTTDRPFARPGDFLALSLNPVCDGASPGFGATAADNVVTVVFTPPNGAADRNNVVILATDCASLEAQRQACESRADVGTATCVQSNGVGDAVGIEVFATGGQRRLRFRFPDTDSLLQGANDDRTFSGAATIAVTGSGDPLPCDLASSSCASQSGLIACVDDFYGIDGTCGKVTPDATFPHFTALPPPNNYQAMCFDPVPPCTGAAAEVRLTTDSAGNLLLPMDWRGILVGQGVPVARLLRGSSSVEAFPGGGSPIVIPGNSFLRSFSPEGGLLPPVFDPQSDPTAANEATLFGSADAPETILRVARRSPTFQQCNGGTNDRSPCVESTDCPGGTCGAAICQACTAGMNAGLACHTATDCPGSTCGTTACLSDTDCPAGIECGPSLFEFRTRYVADVGPVVISRFGAGVCQAGLDAGLPCSTDDDCAGDVCVLYRVVAQDPVPLEGLNQTQQLNAFVISEGVDGKDLNGDLDATDNVVVLADRATGVRQAIGSSGAAGRAVVRVHQPPFSFPAIATEGDVVAFLESESAANDPVVPHLATDQNGDGDTFDAILRVFRLGGAETTASVTPPRAVDAAPKVNGRSLAVSNGEVFFRTSEVAMAQQRTEEDSVDLGQTADYGTKYLGSISADGRYVVFDAGDVRVHDRQTGTNETISVTHDGQPRDGTAEAGMVSADGRYVAFQSNITNLIPNDTNGVQDIFVRDRQSGTTERVSVATNGDQANAFSDSPSISADGRYVAFRSAANDLVSGDTNGFWDMFVHDRQTGVTQRVSVGLGGSEPNNFSRGGAISPDGRYVAFGSDATNLVPSPTYQEVFVYDRQTGTTEQVSVPPSGTGATIFSENPSLSADGRYVAYSSLSANLVPGDTNGVQDVFVYDRQTKTTERVSVATNGDQGNALSGAGTISADGRYVVFDSASTNLVAGDTNGQNDVFVHDRVNGTTERVNVANGGGQANAYTRAGIISADGRYVAFGSAANNLVTNVAVFSGEVIFTRGPDQSDPTSVDASLFPDNELHDTVLQALDTSTGVLTTLCPADEVAVVNGKTAFLRPESSSGTPACPGGSLNSDADVDDAVVQLWPGGGMVQNLHCAATAVVLSDTYVAALVSEAGQGQDLNGDGDQLDNVVMVHRIAGGDPGSCAGWVNTGQAADSLDISGSMVAFLTPESAQGTSGGTDLNGDGDKNDRVMQVWDAAAGQLIPGTQAAEDFVLGATLLAFRTREAAQGNQDLNGDGDTSDDVLQVFDLLSGKRLDTHQAVTPCMLEACDPRVPYRVLNDTVKFLTFEADQSEDLNGNGAANDLVLQAFNVRLAEAQGGVSPLLREASAPQRYKRTVRQGAAVMAGAHTTLGATSAGICTSTGRSCASDANCAGGRCFVPPGGCIRNLGTGCNPSISSSCAAGQFCQPNAGSPGSGTCHQVENNSSGVPGCQSDGDCVASDTCNSADQTFERLVGPLAEASGNVVFTSSGLCVEAVTPAAACTTDANCATGEFCGTTGSCERTQGLCKVASDCPAGATCTFGLLVATDRDSDGDEIPDRFDNCPTVANVAQEDTDINGIGDTCEPCGNGTTDPGEQCDDGNASNGDGCSDACSIEPGWQCTGSPSVCTTICGDGVRTGGETCDGADGCGAGLTCRPDCMGCETLQRVSGVRLVLRDKAGAANKRQITVASKDASIALPAAGGANDPRTAGVTLKVTNPATSETELMSLPAAHWIGLGKPVGSTGYKYKDRDQLAGPCTSGYWKAGKLRVACKGAQITYTLNEPAQGSIAVTLTTGTLRECMLFGGTILKDVSIAAAAAGSFKAKNAPLPVSCPVP